MTVRFHFNGEETDATEITGLVGSTCLQRMVREAWEAHEVDPLEQQDFWLGCGMLTIEF